MADHHGAYRPEKLDELLADPIAVLMMQSDGVEPGEIRILLEKARHARRAQPAPAGRSVDGDSRPN